MSKTTILLVEDEKSLVYILSTNFEREGYRVLTAEDAETGLEMAFKLKPDLIILDIMLPKMNGLEFMKLLRKESHVPALFLTAKKSEVDRILGLSLGADDYITKPFSVQELLARVKAILQRSAPKTGTNWDNRVSVGEIEIDLDRHEVRVRGELTNLTHKEFQLLRLLLEANGKVLSREQLLTQVWGADKGAEIKTRTVDQHIARLRRRLQPEGRRIATVKNFGYKILAD